jgi:hypothetical protein
LFNSSVAVNLIAQLKGNYTNWIYKNHKKLMIFNHDLPLTY